LQIIIRLFLVAKEMEVETGKSKNPENLD